MGMIKPPNPGLFQPNGQDVISTLKGKIQSNFSLNQGSLITFNYAFWKNDPYPLVIVSKVLPGNMICGVNLHYLTFNYIKNMLQRYCNNPGFSYSTIKGDSYIVGAFRSYKWNGIRQIRVLDCGFLLKVMTMVRSFNPADVELIRQQVQEQIQRQVNPRANEINTPPGT